MMSREIAHWWFALIIAAIAPLQALADAVQDAPPIDPASYPILDDKEVGHIRRIVAISRQLPGDWSGMGTDMWSVTERTLQFQLAHMAAVLGLAQHQYTPAYRELYRQAIGSLIDKMTLPDVWETWMYSSRGGTYRSQNDDVGRGWMDPVRKYNVMLTGYLLQYGAMYEMFYRDGKYDRPDAFTFRFIGGGWSNGPTTFRYSLPDIAALTHRQFVSGNYVGVACEPNVVFTMCNQPPLLGFIHFDHTHGTQYAAEILPRYKEAWQREKLSDPKTKAVVGYMEVSTRAMRGSGGSNGWLGGFMHAWDPQFVRTIYDAERDRELARLLSGDYARHVPEHDSKGGISLAFGMFAYWAAEMGDAEARNALLTYADRNFNPVWDDGAYYYPRSDDYQVDAQGNSHGVDAWTGNALLALARLNKGDGLRKLYQQPWDTRRLNEPQITDVDDLTTTVSQAFYDPQRRALVVTVKKGPVAAERVRFTARKLPGSRVRVFKDGRLMAELGKARQSLEGEAVMQPDGSIVIETGIEQPHGFVLAAVDEH